jgi:hypothetical protein
MRIAVGDPETMLDNCHQNNPRNAILILIAVLCIKQGDGLGTF